MSRITWGDSGKRLYETGVDRGVLYPMDATGKYGKGVAWNGLRTVSENPSGAEPQKYYADNIEYANIMSAEEFAAAIGAYTYPPEWKECDGSVEIAPGVYAGQQNRKPFGFTYRTLIGNDTEGTEHGYKLHLVYNGKASPSDKEHESINENPELMEFSWDVSTTPVPFTKTIEGKTLKPTSHIEIDSTKVDATKLAALEDILYGSETDEPRLPTPDEVIDLFTATEVAAG